jgi:hypothetical protein
MNELLKELADKSGFGPAWYDPTIPTSDIDRRWIDQRRLKEFAELIVRECMDRVDRAGSNFNEQPQYNDKQNALVSEGFFWGLESVKQQVKEHFGVEE